MQLSKQEIQHIAKLARLELTDEELEKYGGQLSAGLNYIDQEGKISAVSVNKIQELLGL